MKQEQNNNSIGILPKNLLMLIFSNLDLVSLINAAQVNKQWKTFLESDYTWKIIYQCPHHQKTLYHGQLWESLLQQAGNENANIETVLTIYLKQVFALDLPQNETAVTFFTKCVSYFLGSEKRVDIGEKWFFASRQFKNYEVCERYLKPWTANSILVNIKRIFLQLQELAKVGKVQSEGFVLEKLAHETQDYQSIVKALLQLRQLEQMLVTPILVYQYEVAKNKQEKLSILTDPRWSHLLTLRGLLALEAHVATLNPGALYEKVFLFDLSEEMRKKHFSSWDIEKEIPSEQRDYFECLKKWGSEAKEKELLQGFEGIKGSTQYLLLVEPHLIKQLSDKTVLQLALNATIKIDFLFESPAFVQRLKLILLAEKDKAGQFLFDLIDNKVQFAGEKLLGQGWEEHYSKHFSRGILLHTGLTNFLLDEDLLSVVEKSNLVLWDYLEPVLSSNVDLVCRLTKDCFFLKKFAVAAKCSYLDIIQNPAVMKTITAGTAYQLALADFDLALIFLKNEQTALLLDLEQLQGLQEKYPLNNQNKIGSLYFFIIQREKEATQRAKEQLEREEKELEHKKTPELLKLALSESPLAKAAAGWLNARKGLEDQLSEEALFQLFNHYYRSNLPQNLSNNSEVLFVNQVRLVLAKKSTEELRLLMLDEKAPAIAYLAAETYANKTPELNINDFEILAFVKLLTEYEKLLPNATNILNLLLCDFNSLIEQEEIVKRIESLSSYDNQLVPILKANKYFAKRVARNSSLLLAIVEKFKVSIIELIQQPFLIKHLNGDTVCNLALLDAETADIILGNNELSALLEPQHFQALEEKYSEQDKKQVGNLLQQLVQRENEWLEKQSLEALFKLALAKNENTWLAETAAIYLSKQDTIIGKLPEQDQIDLFNAHNPYDKKIKYTGNEALLFLKSVTNILNKKSNTELCALALDENKPSVSRLAMEFLLTRKVDWNVSTEPKLVELIASHLQDPLFKEYFPELINAPSFKTAFMQAVLSLPFKTEDPKKKTVIYGILEDDLYADFLMKTEDFIHHLSWEEVRNLVKHPKRAVNQIAQSRVINKKSQELITKVFASSELENKKEELKKQEEVAQNYLSNKQYREYARQAWELCAGHAGIEDLDQAQDWLREAKKYLAEPPPGIPQIVLLVEKISELPASYHCIRNEIKEKIRKGEFNKTETTRWVSSKLEEYQEKCKELKLKDQTIMEKHKKVDKVIQGFYDHAVKLQKEADQYINSPEDSDGKKFSIMTKQSVAMRNLADDAHRTFNKLFRQDFSDLNIKFNGEDIYHQLEETIEKHLAGKYLLNVWSKEPEIEDLAPENIYLYKYETHYKAVIVDRRGASKEIVIDDNRPAVKECAGKFTYSENKINAQGKESQQFLDLLQSDYLLNLWDEKPKLDELVPGNVYVYKDEQEYQTIVVKYDGSREEIVVNDQLKKIKEHAQQLPWQENVKVTNVKTEAGEKFLQALKAKGKILPQDNCLREHADSKQKIYNGLAVLSWILIPYMIYKRVTTGTFFYFHANNSTEDTLQKGKPQLRQALTQS